MHIPRRHSCIYSKRYNCRDITHTWRHRAAGRVPCRTLQVRGNQRQQLCHGCKVPQCSRGAGDCVMKNTVIERELPRGSSITLSEVGQSVITLLCCCIKDIITNGEQDSLGFDGSLSFYGVPQGPSVSLGLFNVFCPFSLLHLYPSISLSYTHLFSFIQQSSFQVFCILINPSNM